LILDDRNNIHRTSPGGKTFVYADNTLGRISHIDASDPLKIVIYKRDYGTVTLLDNTLSELEKINLTEKGYNDIPVAAGSNDGNMWLYDVTDYRLKKIKRDGSLILESNSLLDYGYQDVKPSFIQERKGKVILQDQDKGIFMFDNLGQFIQLFPFKIQQNIQFNGSSICFFDSGKFICYHTTLFEENEFDIPAERKAGLINVKAGDNKFYLIYKDGIDIIPIRS